LNRQSRIGARRVFVALFFGQTQLTVLAAQQAFCFKYFAFNLNQIAILHGV
jgi:hypothetical protein